MLIQVAAQVAASTALTSAVTSCLIIEAVSQKEGGPAVAWGLRFSMSSRLDLVVQTAQRS